MNLRRPELLDRQRHDRSAFDSGEPLMDEWLRKYAGQARRDDTAATWVIAAEGYVVVAYASLNLSSVDLSAAPPGLRGKMPPDPIPTLHCGRLAVDRRCVNLGIGTSLLKHVLATAVDINQKAALKAVTVVALHDRARSWWERFGFEAFDPADPDCLDLYILTSDIEETFRALP